MENTWQKGGFMFLLGSSRPVSLMPRATKQAKGGDPVTATSLWDTRRYSSFKANGSFLRDGTAHSTSGLKFPVPTQVDQPWQNAKPFLFLHCFLSYSGVGGASTPWDCKCHPSP